MDTLEQFKEVFQQVFDREFQIVEDLNVKTAEIDLGSRILRVNTEWLAHKLERNPEAVEKVAFHEVAHVIYNYDKKVKQIWHGYWLKYKDILAILLEHCCEVIRENEEEETFAELYSIFLIDDQNLIDTIREAIRANRDLAEDIREAGNAIYKLFISGFH